jgi:antitoxin VapB
MEEAMGPVKPLNIKDPTAYELAHELSRRTGKSLTRVVIDALRNEMNRTSPKAVDMEKAKQILARVHSLPVKDTRSADEILGYNEQGHFD